MRRVWLAAVLAAGCSRTNASSEVPLADPTPPADRPARDTIALPGDGNGAVWDATARTLYVTDDTHDTLAAWTRERGFARAGAFPPNAHLGGLVQLADGRFVATSFGFGTQGAVFVLGPDGARAVPRLDPARRRLGLALAPDGAVYVTYFVVRPGSRHAGGVARLDLAGGEHDVITRGLAKPVGALATDTTLYVADEERGAVLAYSLPEPGEPTVVASGLASEDLLARLPNGDLVTGGRRGAVYRIAPGRVTTIADGFEEVRGLAYDAAEKRLFVVEHSAASSNHKLHILVVE